MGKLDGQVAVITGGGRGQGRAHAVALAAEGADIVVIDIDHHIEGIPYEMNNAGDLEQTTELVEAQGRRCIAVRADVRDAEAMGDVANTAISAVGRIDVLIANAGVWTGKPASELSSAEFATVIDVNLNGVFNAVRAVVGHMIDRSYGRIIATASGAGRMGFQNLSSYTASKWAVIGLVKSLAKELGKHNITVNAINPGFVDTEIVRNDMIRRLYNPELDDPTDADVDQKILGLGIHVLPVTRIPADDIARAAVFLASEDARYISGSTIDVSAGGSANHT
ncbi:mycofactocin-coupled SDR family oxidoreductase [Spirillospora sp. CA-255316]